MSIVLGLSVILLAGTWWVQGLNLCSVMSTVATLLFCGRKIGYFCKLKTVITLESIGIFIAIVWQLLLTDFFILTNIVIVIIRLLFVAIVVYDTEIFVYVTEEKRKES